MTAAALRCPCREPGSYPTRRALAEHIVAAHGVNGIRALYLANRIEEGLALTPEDLAVLGASSGEPAIRRTDSAAVVGVREKAARRGAIAASGLPSDVDLNRVAAGFVAEPIPVTMMPPRRPRRPPVPLEDLLHELVVGLDAPRPPAPSAPKEEPMPKKPKLCKLCARKAPEKCKRHRGSDAKAPAADAGTKRRVKTTKRDTPKPAVARNGGAPLGDNVAKTSAEQLLGHLHALRARLDEKITHVEELCSIL